jgi:small-conductance mechanosensitive channel
METFDDLNTLIATLPTLLAAPATWWQLALVGGSFLIAFLAGQFLQQRLQPMVQTGGIRGVGRTAMRTGILAIIPIIWWALLLAAQSWLRRRGLPSGIVHTALILVGALALIRMSVFVLRHSFSPGSKLKAWEGVLTITIWALVTLHLVGLLPVIVEILDEFALTFGATRISLYTVVSFVLSIALLSLVALWFTNGIQALLRRSEALDESMKIVLAKLSRFVLLLLAVVVAMVTAGIDLTALAVFGGALGVGIGLGLQRIVSNFVGGIVLAFEESIRTGDVIEVKDTFGVVLGLHARHVMVRDNDGKAIMIPNETLLTSEIVNWTHGDRNVRFRLPVQVSYNDDPEQVMKLLLEAARAVPRVLAEPAPSAHLMGLGDHGINLELHVWVNDPESGAHSLRSDVYREIWRVLRAAGVTFPYPRRDVQLVTAATVPAGGRSRET